MIRKILIATLLTVTLFVAGCTSHQNTVKAMQENRLNAVLALAESALKSNDKPLAELDVRIPGGTTIPLGEELVINHKVREPIIAFFTAALDQTDYPIPPSQFIQVLDKLVGPALTLGTAWLSFDFAKNIATSSLSVASTAAAREPLVVEPTIVQVPQ